MFGRKEFSRLGASQVIPLSARLLFATHRNLAEMVKEGTFREVVYYRINVMGIRAQDSASVMRTFHNWPSTPGGVLAALPKAGQQTIQEFKGNKTLAARSLHISRPICIGLLESRTMMTNR